MIEFLNSIQNSLVYKNFFLVLSGLDNTILLLLNHPTIAAAYEKGLNKTSPKLDMCSSTFGVVLIKIHQKCAFQISCLV